MEKLSGVEKIFYEYQKPARECRIIDEVDIDFETECEIAELQRIQNKEKQKEELYIMRGEIEESGVFSSTEINLNESTTEINLNESINPSGKIRSIIQKFEIALKTDQVQFECPWLRIKKRVCTDEIKATCANLSS